MLNTMRNRLCRVCLFFFVIEFQLLIPYAVYEDIDPLFDHTGCYLHHNNICPITNDNNLFHCTATSSSPGSLNDNGSLTPPVPMSSCISTVTKYLCSASDAKSISTERLSIIVHMLGFNFEKFGDTICTYLVGVIF